MAVPVQDEAAIRRDLAAAYRLIALFGWDDHVSTHLSARLPDGTFLLNPFGLMFEEITASSLIRVDLDGNVLSPAGAAMNVAAYTVHSAIWAGRSDVGCAIHLHSRDGVAVSTLKDGLLPLNQTALLIWHDIAYHAYEGVVSRAEERARLQADIGTKNLMILRNHGTLAVGQTVADAFYRSYTLEWCCTAQVRALSMGREIAMPSPAVIDSMAGAMDFTRADRFPLRVFWPAMLRKAARECPGFDA